MEKQKSENSPDIILIEVFTSELSLQRIIKLVQWGLKIFLQIRPLAICMEKTTKTQGLTIFEPSSLMTSIRALHLAHGPCTALSTCLAIYILRSFPSCLDMSPFSLVSSNNKLNKERKYAVTFIFWDLSLVYVFFYSSLEQKFECNKSSFMNVNLADFGKYSYVILSTLLVSRYKIRRHSSKGKKECLKMEE